MAAVTTGTLVQVDHGANASGDPNLATVGELAVAMNIDSAAVSVATSKMISTTSATAPDSLNLSIADSKGVSSGGRASIADSKAVSGSGNTSVADSKALSVSGSTSIADSKAVSVATATIIPTINGIPGFLQAGTGAVLRTANAKMADKLCLVDFADSGSGTSGSPWNGWDARLAFTTTRKRIEAPAGYYTWTNPLNLTRNGLCLEGEGALGTTLKFLGTGPAIMSDGGAGAANGIFGLALNKLLIRGTALATIGIYLRNCHHINIEDVSIIDVTTAGVSTDFSIVGFCKNLKVDVNEVAVPVETFMPVDGILLDGHGGTGPTNAWTIINPIVTGCSGWGIRMALAQSNNIIGGDSESNTSGSLICQVGANGNRIIGLYANGEVRDDTVGWNEYRGLNGALLHLSGSQNTKVLGGHFQDITIDNGAFDCELENVTYTGTLSDSGTRTRKSNVSKYTVSNQVYAPEGFTVGLLSGATTTIPFSDFGNVEIRNTSLGGTAKLVVDPLTSPTVSIEYGTSGHNFATASTGGKTAITYAAGVLTIENREGGTRAYRVKAVPQ